MWYLIFVVLGTNYTQPAITLGGEYTDEKQCIYAGAQVETTLRSDLGYNTKKYSFTCVKK